MDDSNEAQKLIMQCMMLAISYYPNTINNNNNQHHLQNDTNNSSSALDEIDHLFGLNVRRVATTTVHPSFEHSTNAGEFITDCIKPSPKRPYEIPWEQKTLWAFFFGIMLIVAIVGNSIVIWIVLAHREMRTITNYFLLNLSVADLLMSLLNCVFNFIYMLNSDWPFGSLYCSVNNFMGNVTVATSVFTLVAISFDRYVAIIRPLHRRNSRKKARIFLAIIWTLSTLLSMPGLLYSATESKKYHNGKTRTVCYLQWPDGKYPLSVADYVYNIVFLILTYGIPMLVMVICYTLMGKELWGSQSIGEHTERQRESVKSKKKVVRMFIAIVSIFGICWMPYHMFYVYAYHNPSITSSSYVPHLFLGFYWLAMSNSMVNPIIYYWMNRKFRHYFQEVMCCFQLWKSNVIHKTQDIYLQQHSMSIERRKSCRNHHFKNNFHQQQLQQQQQQQKQNHDSKSGRQSEINNHSQKT